MEFSLELFALVPVLSKEKPLLPRLKETAVTFALTEGERKDLRGLLFSLFRHLESRTFQVRNAIGKVQPGSTEEALNLLTLETLSRNPEAQEEIRKDYLDTIRKENLLLQEEDFDSLVSASKVPFSLDERTRKVPRLANALVLEMPVFLSDLLDRTYSPKEKLALSTALRRAPQLYGFTNTLKEGRKPSKEKDSLLSVGKGPSLFLPATADEPFFRSRDAVFVSLPMAKLLSSLDFPAVQPKILLYGLDDIVPAVYLENLLKDSYQPDLLLVVDGAEKKERMEKRAQAYGLSHTRVLDSSLFLLKTYEPDASYDAVLLFENGCRYGENPFDPSLLPLTGEEDLRRQEEREKQELKELSRFVKPAGDLVLVTHTLDELTLEKPVEALSSYFDGLHRRKAEIRRYTPDARNNLALSAAVYPRS